MESPYSLETLPRKVIGRGVSDHRATKFTDAIIDGRPALPLPNPPPCPSPVFNCQIGPRDFLTAKRTLALRVFSGMA